MYNVVYENATERQGKVILSKYGHKHFNSIEDAEKWIADNKIKAVSLQIWDANIDCFSTIKTY